jgi:hypothetical protein
LAHSHYQVIVDRWPRKADALASLAKSYYHDADYTSAHLITEKMVDLNRYYGLPRKLSLEIDMGMRSAAAASAAEICQFPIDRLAAVFHIVSRAEGYLGDGSPEITISRRAVFDYVITLPDKTPFQREHKIALLNQNRWLIEAREVLERGRGNIKPSLRSKIDQNFEGLGVLKELLSTANFNEKIDLGKERLFAMDGSVFDRSKLAGDTKLIEFFLPTVFFNFGTPQKNTYEQVRTMFQSVYSHLKGLGSTYVLMPRMQYNWRYINRRCQGLAISYHTKSEVTAVNIQESTIQGRFTVDSNGFAGFSSLAACGRSDLKLRIGDISAHDAGAFREKLFCDMSANNQSKYVQSEEQFRMEGDYVFVALQVQTDAVTSLAERTGKQLLDLVMDKYQDTDVDIVVKRHPYCRSKTLSEKLAVLARTGKIQISNASIHGLISGAVAVYCVNSGVGFESLLHQKDVYVFGGCDYREAATSISSQGEVQPALSLEERDLFISYYVNNYLVSFDDHAAVADKIDGLCDIFFSRNELG